MVCKNLQLNDCLVAQQLKNIALIVQGNSGFISAQPVHLFKLRRFYKQHNQSAEQSIWHVFSLKSELNRCSVS